MALQKSPSFDWLYLPIRSTNTSALAQGQQQEFDNIIRAFEQISPDIYTQNVMSLKAMADELVFPPRQFSNAINHHYGESYTKRMNRMRVAFAGRLLLEQPELSISTAMYEAGFQTKSNFNKEFKQSMGCRHQNTDKNI